MEELDRLYLHHILELARQTSSGRGLNPRPPATQASTLAPALAGVSEVAGNFLWFPCCCRHPYSHWYPRYCSHPYWNCPCCLPMSLLLLTSSLTLSLPMPCLCRRSYCRWRPYDLCIFLLFLVPMLFQAPLLLLVSFCSWRSLCCWLTEVAGVLLLLGSSVAGILFILLAIMLLKTFLLLLV